MQNGSGARVSRAALSLLGKFLHKIGRFVNMPFALSASYESQYGKYYDDNLEMIAVHLYLLVPFALSICLEQSYE